MMGFDALAQSLTPSGCCVQFSHNPMRSLYIAGKLGDPQLSLQTKPFHRRRLVSGGKTFALITTFDKSQFTASVESRLESRDTPFEEF